MSDRFDDTDTGILNEWKTKRNPKGPDFSGSLTVGQSTLRGLIEMHKSGKPAKLRVAGWNRTSKKGNPFISVKVEVATEDQRGGQYAQKSAAPPAPPASAPIIKNGHQWVTNKTPPHFGSWVPLTPQGRDQFAAGDGGPLDSDPFKL